LRLLGGITPVVQRPWGYLPHIARAPACGRAKHHRPYFILFILLTFFATIANLDKQDALDGLSAHFLFVISLMDLREVLETAVIGLGYELVDLEMSNHGKLLRVFIDKTGGINVGDCSLVSNHLIRLFAVENLVYDRLEVSSPGLDRVLKKQADFERFAGEKAQIKVRLPVSGQRNFVGVLRGINGGFLQLEVDGRMLSLDLANLEKARLIPNI
jgi:ribosome maturation factor RimP